MTGNAPARFPWRALGSVRAGGGVPHEVRPDLAGP
jgi:hypothetical protein